MMALRLVPQITRAASVLSRSVACAYKQTSAVLGVCQSVQPSKRSLVSLASASQSIMKSCAVPQQPAPLIKPLMLQSLLPNQAMAQLSQVRTRTTWSFKSGKPRTVKAVLRRFFRLNNGRWIRTQCGRHKKRWAKNPRRMARLQYHVFCNATQCRLLDKMVNRSVKLPTYYVNDPYEPYHRWTNVPEFKYRAPKFLP